MSVTSEAAAAEAVESLADTAEDLEIDVEAGESSSEEEEEEGVKAGLAIKNPPKKTQKTLLKKTLKMGFMGFFGFFVFF
jgi:hypothetical protein